MIRIDTEFKTLIPALTTEERQGLESSLKAEGCRDALVLWGDTLIDGHNRFEICTRYGIPYKTVQREFASRQDVIEWIILNQFGRRNLPAHERARLALRLKPVIAEKAKEKQIEAGGALRQKSDKAEIDTKKELAKIAGVSHDTIAKVEKIEEEAPTPIVEASRKGEISVNAAYQVTKLEPEQQEEIAKRIENIKEEPKETSTPKAIVQDVIASGEYDLQTEIAELQDIEIDMSNFGFDVPALEIELEDKEIQHEENKQTAVDRFTNILNQNKAEYEGVGEYGIPDLAPVYETPKVEKWIDFDYVLREKEPENKGVHFFIHDYKFERIWVQPEQYIDKLKRFAVVATPDFTPFTEFPQAMQIWQYYRKMWVGKFLQENGVTVIPTVRDIWDMHGNPRSWWLDGTPTGGIIMVSDMWSYIPRAQKECEYTMQTIKERIQPSKVYVYNRQKGSDYSKWFDNFEYVSAWSQKKWNG